MTRTPRLLTRALRLPGVWKARRAVELAVTPQTRIDVDRLDQATRGLGVDTAGQVEQLRRSVADIEVAMPAVLNAIASMNGATRMVKREFEAVRNQSQAFREESEGFRDEIRSELERLSADIDERIEQGDLDVLGQVRPHAETLGWLMHRVETVRFEMLNELRYGQHADGPVALETRVLNPAALDASPLRVNIGAGHIPMEGYVNVDMRELPGIDVIGTVENLPFERGSLDEIFSSHTLEHFPQETLRRQLLPYWSSLLKPGGTLRTIAPDLDAMSNDYVNGATSFEDFREVMYGGQEYEGDSHFTGFTPDSFTAMLLDAGFVDAETVAFDRQNGKCKEFEITARKAA